MNHEDTAYFFELLREIRDALRGIQWELEQRRTEELEEES